MINIKKFLKVLCCFSFLFMAGFVIQAEVEANQVLLIDDFDRGLQSNRLGGIAGGDIESPGFCFFGIDCASVIAGNFSIFGVLVWIISTVRDFGLVSFINPTYSEPVPSKQRLYR